MKRGLSVRVYATDTNAAAGKLSRTKTRKNVVVTIIVDSKNMLSRKSICRRNNVIFKLKIARTCIHNIVV